MARNGARKRKSLFERFSRHITLYEPEKRDIFVCPLCMRGFTRKALDGPDPQLSLAHIIPQKLGGTRYTLTCTLCNNEGGRNLEIALLERFRAEDTMTGMTRSSGRFLGPFGDIGVEFKFSPDEKAWSVYAIDHQTNPANVEALSKYAREVGRYPKDDIHLIPRYRHQPAEVKAAVYQSALLLMFHYFGYEFLVHRHFTPLREQVAHPEKEILPSKIAQPTFDFANAALEKKECAVMFVEDPPVILTILRFCPKGGTEKTFAVVLPGLDNTDVSSLEYRSGRGSLIPYQPEMLYETKWYLNKLWKHTRKKTVGA